MKFFQQGDVVLIPCKEIPTDLVSHPANAVQEGEVTGHAHRLQGDAFEIFAPKGKYNNDTPRKHLRVVRPTMLRHEEHKEIHLPPGDYEVRIVKEYDHFKEEARRVAD